MFFNRRSTSPGSLEKKIENLKRDLISTDRLLKRRPNDDTTYFYKASKLMEIFQLTEEEASIKEALENYNNAIKIDPNNAQYIIDRATCYINLKQTDLAHSDLENVKFLPKIDGVIGLYIRNEIEKIEQYFDSLPRLS